MPIAEEIDNAPASINETSMEQGMGTPESPLGAKVAGATPQQAAMTGTPAQKQGATNERKTLEASQRYTPSTQEASAADIQAKEKSERLSSLGPVRSRVEGMIQTRMEAVQQQSAELQMNEDAISNLPLEQQEAARLALGAYIANPQDETKAKAFSDIIGMAGIAGGGIENYLAQGSEVIGQAAQGQLGAAVTLAELDLAPLGVDINVLATDLGIPVDVLSTYNLAQLDEAIDSVEAQELSKVDNLRAQLSDPRLPPAQRQALLKQLGELGASGVTGGEENIDLLDQQILNADKLEIGGVEYSLEDALGDEGISATIANAVVDPEQLEKLKNMPGFEDLADWVENNKGELEELVGEIDTTARGFVETQEEYQKVVGELGEDGIELLRDLTGKELDGSILSTDFQEMVTNLETNKAYQVIKEDPELLTMVKDDPEALDEIVDMAEGDMEVEHIQAALELKKDIATTPILEKFMDGEWPPTSQEALTQMEDVQEQYESLPPEVSAASNQLLEIEGISLDDLTEIGGVPPRPDAEVAEIINDLLSNKTESEQWDLQFKNSKDPAGDLQMNLFGAKGLDARDFELALNTLGDPETEALLKDIFDIDGDGVVTDKELSNPEAATRAKDKLGLGADKDSIIGQGGAWNPQDIRDSLAGKVQADAWKRLPVEDQIKHGYFDKKEAEKIKADYASSEAAITKYHKDTKEVTSRLDKSKEQLANFTSFFDKWKEEEAMWDRKVGTTKKAQGRIAGNPLQAKASNRHRKNIAKFKKRRNEFREKMKEMQSRVDVANESIASQTKRLDAYAKPKALDPETTKLIALFNKGGY